MEGVEGRNGKRHVNNLSILVHYTQVQRQGGGGYTCGQKRNMYYCCTARRRISMGIILLYRLDALLVPEVLC